jgi:gliding motility-associated-like protein
VNTTYTVTGTDTLGCSNTSSITIDVNVAPVAAFDTNIVSINCQGSTYDFVNTSTNATSYNWTFGDGTTSSSADPQHAFNFGTSYTTMLTAISGNCFDSLSVEINPGNLSTYFDSVPNIFTPNNDGINDCFEVSSQGDFSSCTVMKIFNKWGNLIFESSNTQLCWNGKDQQNKNDFPDGTYFYSIIVNDTKYNGSILLLR